VGVVEKQREMPTFPQSFPMNGGDGPHSYIHNSSYQVSNNDITNISFYILYDLKANYDTIAKIVCITCDIESSDRWR